MKYLEIIMSLYLLKSNYIRLIPAIKTLIIQ
jgi:hypothetical protein